MKFLKMLIVSLVLFGTATHVHAEETVKESLLPTKVESKDIVLKNSENDRKSAENNYKNEVSRKEQASQLSSYSTPSSNTNSAPSTSTASSTGKYTLKDIRFLGVINWNGFKYTYYSQSVLPGGGLRIPGRHVSADGFVCDGDGYIVVANDRPKGSVVPTPFGRDGKVYDRGTYGNHIDIYTK